MDLLYKDLIDEALEELNFPQQWTREEIERLHKYRPVIKFRSEHHYELVNSILLEIVKIPKINDIEEKESDIELRKLDETEFTIDFGSQIFNDKELKEIAKIIIPIVHLVPKADDIVNFYHQNEKFIQFADKMYGQELSEESKAMYEDILKIQKELFELHGSGQRSSLAQAARNYSTRNHLFWDEAKVNSVCTMISRLRDKGRIK